MRRFQLLFASLVTCLTVGASSTLLAQVGSSPISPQSHPGSTVNSSPPADALRVANELLPEFEKILDQWIANSSNMYPLCLTYSRSEFSHVFNIERVMKCTCFIDSPHRWMIRECSVKLAKGSSSKRKDPQGKPYKLETGRAFSQLCTTDALLLLDDDEKTCSKLAIDEKDREAGDVRIGYPLRLLENPEEIRRLFKLSVVNDNEKTVTLLGSLRTVNTTKPDPFNWNSWFSFSLKSLCGGNADFLKIAVTLDKSTCVPIQIRTLGEDRTECLYTIDSIEFLSSNGRISEWYPDDGVGRTGLQGYKCIDFEAPVNCEPPRLGIAPDTHK